jgi:hypothetical protein
MARMRNTLLLPMAFLAFAVGAAPAAGAAPAGRAQTLFFDALFTHAQTSGPGPAHVGHREGASGVLRDAAGRSVGTFSFICTWTRVSAAGALEHCVGSASTGDGRLDAAGPAVSNSDTHNWRIVGGTGRYLDAAGAIAVRDLGDRESLLSAAVRTPDHATLRDGKVSRPVANDAFIARANGLCRRAAQALSSLPPFPFRNFDPLHPRRALLPKVGAFFAGPGDPRPILGALDKALRDLQRPPGERGVWRAALAARERELRIIDQQDRAALASDVRTFVMTVRDSAANFREIAITATVFGASRCVL